MNKVLREAIATPELQRRLALEGTEPLASTPEDYAADIDQDEATWSKVPREASVRHSE